MLPMKKNPNLGNILRGGAIVVPWICSAIAPILLIDRFCLNPLRILFFDFVMVPFSNIALLGMTANGQDRSFSLIAVFVFAGIVLPPVLALLFVRYWKRWQFTLIWLGYIVLLAWDVLMALFIIGILVKGGIRTWL